MMSNTVVCSRSRYSLSCLIAIDYGGIYCRTLPKWITVYTRLAKETKRGEQLAAEAEKREELATVAAEIGEKVVKKVTFPKGFTARSTHTWDEDSLGNTYMSNGHRMNSAGYLANPSRSAQIRARDAGALTNREAASMGLTNKRDVDDELGFGDVFRGLPRVGTRDH